jgi:hypothetical protein
LIFSAGTTLLWAFGPRPWSKLQAFGLAFALSGCVVALAATANLQRYGAGWPDYWAVRSAEVTDALDVSLQELYESGERAADQTAAATDSLEGAALTRAVRRIREETGMAALAVYGPDGRLVTWDGTHRGKVPEEVLRQYSRFAYGESPLFSYFYSTAPLERTGGIAVAASLLRAELPPGLRGEEDDFASRFRKATGESVRIFESHRVSEGTPLDFTFEGRSLFSLEVVRPSQGQRRDQMLRRWLRIVGALVLLAWLFLAAGGHGRPWQLPLAAVVLITGAALAPVDGLVRDTTAPASGGFLLPGPAGLTLMRVLALSVAAALVAGMLAPRGRGPLKKAWLGIGVPVAVLFPAAVWALREGVSTSLLAGPEGSFLVFQSTLALLLTLVAYVSFRLHRIGEGGSGAAATLLAGLVIPPLLAVYAVVFVRQFGTFPSWAAVFWAFPAVLLGRGLDRSGMRWRGLPRWALAVLLGSTAALTFSWAARTEGRVARGETRMAQLADPVDPYLQFLLYRFGDRVQELDAGGAGAVEILYRGWVDSGLAEGGYPLWLTVWSQGDMPQEEFQIGVSRARPAATRDLLDQARLADSVSIVGLGQANAKYIAVVPLGGGAVATAVVPPVGQGTVSSPLANIFSPVLDPEVDALTLEMLLATPGQNYHVHYTVAIPGGLILSARATLIFFMNLVVFLAVWGVGRIMARGLRRPFRGWRVMVT